MLFSENVIVTYWLNSVDIATSKMYHSLTLTVVDILDGIISIILGETSGKFLKVGNFSDSYWSLTHFITLFSFYSP